MNKVDKEKLMVKIQKQILKAVTNKDLSVAEACCLLDSIKVYLYFENDVITGFVDGKKVDFRGATRKKGEMGKTYER